MSRRVHPGGTLDLLEELDAIARAEDAAARAQAVAAAPPPPPTTCSCGDRREAGFTSPRPGWWVHAECGLPTPEFRDAQAAVERAAAVRTYVRVQRDGATASAYLSAARCAELAAAGWTVTAWDDLPHDLLREATGR